MIKRTTIFICVVLLICSTFVACNTNADETVEPQELFNSITQQDIDNAIANPDEFTEEELEYYESILDWYEYSIGVSGEVSWSDTLEIVGKLVKYYEISPDGFPAFYEKVQNQEAQPVKISGNLMFVPADVVEDYIGERFNIDKEAFRNEAWRLDEYEYVEQAYAFSMDMGYGGLYDYSILKVEKSGNIWKFYCSNSYPLYYESEEIFEEDYAVIVVEHKGENDYKFLCAKGFHEDKFAPLRARFEYPFSDGLPECDMNNVGIDETVPQENLNSEFLSLLYYSARTTIDYETEKSISGYKKATAAISVFRKITLSEDYGQYLGDDDARIELIKYGAEPEFVPKEWVEKAVKQIWGEEATVEHTNSFDWVYNKDLGVYVPRYIASGYAYPYVHSIEKTEKGFVAEISVLYMGNDSLVWGDTGEFDYTITDPKYYNDIFADSGVVDLAKKQMRVVVTAEYAEDGNLYLVSSVAKTN